MLDLILIFIIGAHKPSYYEFSSLFVSSFTVPIGLYWKSFLVNQNTLEYYIIYNNNNPFIEFTVNDINYNTFNTINSQNTGTGILLYINDNNQIEYNCLCC